MQKLDYTHLQHEFTDEELLQYQAKNGNAEQVKTLYHLMRVGFGVAGATVYAVIMGFVILPFISGSLSGSLALGLFVAASIIVPVLTWFVYHYANNFAKMTRKRRLKLALFAQQNNLKYSAMALGLDFKGKIFGEEMHGLMIVSDILLFNDGSTVSNYRLMASFPSNGARTQDQRRKPRWGCAQIKLSHPQPHMVLDSKTNEELQGYTKIPEMFGNIAPLSLEGDFNKYFSLYVQDAHRLEALSIFTPDVMAALVDYGKIYDVEIVDDTLILYTGENIDFNSPESLQQILLAIEKIATKIIRQS